MGVRMHTQPCPCQLCEALPPVLRSTLPTDHAERKATPIFSGVLMYFPRALAAVAQCSVAGNQQHHPDKPLHWDKSKSTDEPDALVRHLMARGTLDSDGIRHSAKVAWRALALLEREIEGEQNANLGKESDS